MISTSRVVTPRATWNLSPSHGVSILIWLSVNCYCFAPHHKHLSLLSLFLFLLSSFLKKLTMYLPHGYIYASLGSRHTKDFGNQIRINLEVRGRSRAFVCVHPPLPPPPPPPPPYVTGAPATQVTAGVVRSP